MSNFLKYISVLILPILTTLTVVIAILFDGKLVAEGKKSLIRRIKPVAYLLIFITLSLNVFQAIDSNKTLDDTKKQAKDKELKDSSRIAELQILAKTNLIKTDSVKVQLIDNAVKALDEQRQMIERERENVFIHFQVEVKENLSKILINYNEKIIRSYIDSTSSFSSRLSSIYIKKYQSISNQMTIIDRLMKIEESIDKINNYADDISKLKDRNAKEITIKMFLLNNELLYSDIVSIYSRIKNLKTYKEYESLDFSKAPPTVNREELYNSLDAEWLYDHRDAKPVLEYIKKNKITFLDNKGKVLK